MKITFLSPHLKISGGVMIIVQYVHYLTLLGHDVEIVVVNPIMWRRVVANFFRFRPFWMRSFKIRVRRVPELKEGYLVGNDIVVVSAMLLADKVFKFSDKIGKKVCLLQHNEGMYHCDPVVASRVYEGFDDFIVVASWLNGVLKKESGKSAEVILNTIDKNVFYNKKSERNGEKIRVLVLHHTYDWKGYNEVAKIVGDLKNDFSDIEFVAYGARQESKPKEVDEYYYKPSGSDLADIMRSCDIFICGSWDEGFGLPSLEAMACGCAIVTYDNGGSRDFAVHEKNSLVAKRRDVDDLKKNLRRLIVDSDLRKKLSLEGANFVASDYPDWREQGDKIENFLRNVINR